MTLEEAIDELSVLYERYSKASENREHTVNIGNYGMIDGQYVEALDMAIKALEQQPSREWKEIYAESEGSNSWIEFKCPHCGYSFGMESGEYDWHYGDEIPWKYCPICGGSAEHNPYKAESEGEE